MLSYAQNGEDVLLQRAFPKEYVGFYVDVGANDPEHDSVTKHFYDRGWRGINIEPGEIFGRLASERPRDVNLKLVASDVEGELVYYEMPKISGWSTTSAEVAEKCRREGVEIIERRVESLTLTTILGQHAADTIDFLKIDVEGAEARVIAGNDWTRFRPRIVVGESGHAGGWAETLEGAGYLPAIFDGINRFFVREEDRALLPALSVPVNVLDDYVPHRYVYPLLDRVAKLEGMLAGPDGTEVAAGALKVGLGIARGLTRLSRTFPRTAATFRSSKRFFGGSRT